jgi:hypothetical protein
VATVYVTLTDNGGTANGGVDTSPTLTFTITITPVNDPPTAVNDSATIAPDSGPNAIDVLANDSIAPDTGETLTIIAVTQGANGSVAITGIGTGLTYAPNPGFTGNDLFSYTISDGNGGFVAATVNITVSGGQPTQFFVFLPLVMRDPKPDLVGSFSLNPGNPSAGQPVAVTLVITNQGSMTAGAFWVDFYINPSQAPTAPNMLWDDLCGLTPCYGMAWYVPAALAPGQSITLTSTPNGYCQDGSGGANPAGYCNNASIWPGAFASGTQHLYLFVDSSNPGVATGGVNESDETNNRAELHFVSPLDSQGGLGLDASLSPPDAQEPEDLPPRQPTP